MKDHTLKENLKLDEHYSGQKDWLRWGPYLSERQWGTVREDYSDDGNAWKYFPHDHARSRSYRWGEDGIAGISDRYCNICFAPAFWNGRDPIIKERLFGLTGNEGNHGEDVKELYYYLENTPTHSYMKHLYKYPQNAFPYEQLTAENKKRSKKETEFELIDTGIFDKKEYFDVLTEYAKADSEDLLIKISACNRAATPAKITLLPTIWMRNLWSFEEMSEKPMIKKEGKKDKAYLSIVHPYVGQYFLYVEKPSRILFTENETNTEKLFNTPNDHHFKKDLFHQAITSGDFSLAEKNGMGTKSAIMYELEISPGETKSVCLRLSSSKLDNPFDAGFERIFKSRRHDSEAFFNDVSKNTDVKHKEIQKQALAGLMWSKQYYHYDVERWLQGDPKTPPPPPQRKHGRNSNWITLRNHDIHAMPDAWEYPWYAAWDSAFHCLTWALVDSEFAKHQLLLFTKEWYMAPNGQIPAYEWSFSDVNPPVQAWAALSIYQIEMRRKGIGDIKFLKKMFNKLALNFTWWVNREDSTQNNVFEGGFLGLDNIGVFDRSHGIPGEAHLEQVDGTAWMALYCLNMLEMSLEIARHDDTYEDMATKYFGHFVYIAEALNNISKDYVGTWDSEEGFFYDKLVFPNGSFVPIKVRSIVGLMSLAAVLRIDKETLKALPRFERSVVWFKKHRMETLKYPVIQEYAEGEDLLLSLVPKDRMEVLVKTLLREDEFLSPYGIRSLSKVHQNAYNLYINGSTYCINYEPAESSTYLFGGNSNWRGPIWMPINYIFIDSLKEYFDYGGEALMFDFPTGSGNRMHLGQIATELSKRLIQIFEKNQDGYRVVHHQHQEMYKDEHFNDLILFYEYFHADNGRGVGASHQTGWTALIANLIDNMA
ncbi:MAG: glucosidase [Cyclobacteriaceae bacterium]|nr:glucosidase [Cyclobacteriaceae bacterium]